MRKVVDRVQLVDKLIYYMQYPFVKYALVVGILIALCSSLFGATLVLKRFSFIGDGLSHVAFGAMAVGSVSETDKQHDYSDAGDCGCCNSHTYVGTKCEA